MPDAAPAAVTRVQAARFDLHSRAKPVTKARRRFRATMNVARSDPMMSGRLSAVLPATTGHLSAVAPAIDRLSAVAPAIDRLSVVAPAIDRPSAVAPVVIDRHFAVALVATAHPSRPIVRPFPRAEAKTIAPGRRSIGTKAGRALPTVARRPGEKSGLPTGRAAAAIAHSTKTFPAASTQLLPIAASGRSSATTARAARAVHMAATDLRSRIGVLPMATTARPSDASRALPHSKMPVDRSVPSRVPAIVRLASLSGSRPTSTDAGRFSNLSGLETSSRSTLQPE